RFAAFDDLAQHALLQRGVTSRRLAQLGEPAVDLEQIQLTIVDRQSNRQGGVNRLELRALSAEALLTFSERIVDALPMQKLAYRPSHSRQTSQQVRVHSDGFAADAANDPPIRVSESDRKYELAPKRAIGQRRPR